MCEKIPSRQQGQRRGRGKWSPCAGGDTPLLLRSFEWIHAFPCSSWRWLCWNRDPYSNLWRTLLQSKFLKNFSPWRAHSGADLSEGLHPQWKPMLEQGKSARGKQSHRGTVVTSPQPLLSIYLHHSGLGEGRGIWEEIGKLNLVGKKKKKRRWEGILTFVFASHHFINFNLQQTKIIFHKSICFVCASNR